MDDQELDKDSRNTYLLRLLLHESVRYADWDTATEVSHLRYLGIGVSREHGVMVRW
jgi:hypothetical protein